MFLRKNQQVTMAKLQVETGKDNHILRTKSDEITDLGMKTPKYGLGLVDFVKEMKRNLVFQKGLGLAAPQVGENIRLILCRMNGGTDNEILFVMVNPEIIDRSWTGDMSDLTGAKTDQEGCLSLPEGTEIAEEGCLSLPGYYAQIVRAHEILVKFRDGRSLLKGSSGSGSSRGGSGNSGSGKKGLDLPELTLQLGGLNARVVQHEIDHLDGVLICDKTMG